MSSRKKLPSTKTFAERKRYLKVCGGPGPVLKKEPEDIVKVRRTEVYYPKRAIFH